jgi:membrane protease YdiL (CAAX protease family)
MGSSGRAWPVFVTYVVAFVTIILFSLVAAVVVRSLDPDVPVRGLLQGLPGLIAGGVASSLALLLTVLLVERPLVLARLRLVPGREQGRHLLVMVLGVLALGQSLDSLTMVSGLGRQGAMAVIRDLLDDARAGELLAAVVVIGLLAGTAEEVFFRGYMQTRLRESWGSLRAVAVTGLCFAGLHLEWLHASLALALGLYLGFITELAGSALPAIVCHVVNNTVFTLVTALAGTVERLDVNLALLVGGIVVFAACVAWLRWSLPPALVRAR